MRQTEALAILNAGANVFLTGAPGAGKTYVLNEFIRQARADGASVAVTASTGIASTHINGQTIQFVERRRAWPTPERQPAQTHQIPAQTQDSGHGHPRH